MGWSRWLCALVLTAGACTPEPPPAVKEPAPTRAPAAATASGDDARGPMAPISGVPLAGGSGLRLLVTGNRRVELLDPDTGLRSAIGGIPGAPYVWSFAVGDSAAVGTSRDGEDWTFYRVDGDRGHRIATGAWAFPAADGRGLWVGDKRCGLRGITLDGRVRQARTPFACKRQPAADQPLGFLVRDNQGESHLVSRDTGEQVPLGATAPGRVVLASVGDRALVRSLDPASGDERLSLVQAGTARTTPLATPDTAGRASDAALISAGARGSGDGRWIALEFADPAWPGPRQYLDFWVLDLRTLRWTRVPGMPVPAAIKTTTASWTPDGRLVIAGLFQTTSAVQPGDDDYAGAVAVWKPGEPKLSLRWLPLRDGESLTVLSR